MPQTIVEQLKLLVIMLPPVLICKSAFYEPETLNLFKMYKENIEFRLKNKSIIQTDLILKSEVIHYPLKCCLLHFHYSFSEDRVFHNRNLNIWNRILNNSNRQVGIYIQNCIIFMNIVLLKYTMIIFISYYIYRWIRG